MNASGGGWKRFARPAALAAWALAGAFAWSVFLGAPGCASNVEAGVVFLVWMFVLSAPLGLPLLAIIDVVATEAGWNQSGLVYVLILWAAVMALSYLQWFVILPRWARRSRLRFGGKQ